MFSFVFVQWLGGRINSQAVINLILVVRIVATCDEVLICHEFGNEVVNKEKAYEFGVDDYFLSIVSNQNSSACQQ